MGNTLRVLVVMNCLTDIEKAFKDCVQLIVDLPIPTTSGFKYDFSVVDGQFTSNGSNRSYMALKVTDIVIESSSVNIVALAKDIDDLREHLLDINLDLATIGVSIDHIPTAIRNTNGYGFQIEMDEDVFDKQIFDKLLHCGYHFSQSIN